MVFRLALKDPAGVDESLRLEAKRQICRQRWKHLSDTEIDDVIEERERTLQGIASRWIDNQGHVQIEIDADSGVARVLPSGGPR